MSTQSYTPNQQAPHQQAPHQQGGRPVLVPHLSAGGATTRSE